MPVLSIAHIMTYAYPQPVALGEHRLMVRPRESNDRQLLDARIDIDSAPARRRWLHGVVGNAVARVLYRAVPLSGSVPGFSSSDAGMEVIVTVTIEDPRC